MIRSGYCHEMSVSLKRDFNLGWSLAGEGLADLLAERPAGPGSGPGRYHTSMATRPTRWTSEVRRADVHNLCFAKPENRMKFFQTAEQFLARYLGGRAEP
jgi:hypothetical protein